MDRALSLAMTAPWTLIAWVVGLARKSRVGALLLSALAAFLLGHAGLAASNNQKEGLAPHPCCQLLASEPSGEILLFRGRCSYQQVNLGSAMTLTRPIYL
jgi:hypothetical protein